jgi:tRNA threonylcarbamoyladenosine biosynthesis protein TsaB
MKLLALDTGTEVMSIAVSRSCNGACQQWSHTAAGGAQASTGLIAAILDLMGQAGLRLDELDAICFGAGPGSFTGLRTACSVTQGLAFGAGVPVLPVDSLLAVAEEARFAALNAPDHCVISALLDARMQEVYLATYAFSAGQWTTLQGCSLVAPQAVAQHLQRLDADRTDWSLAGNAFAVYPELIPEGELATALCSVASPTATAMLRLAPQLLGEGRAVSAAEALPTYIRDKVAQTTQERVAEKAAALARVPVAGA